MSNVHGFSSNRPRNNQRRDHDHDDDYDYESTPFLGGYLRTSGDPRKETVWDMLRFSCCPTFKLFSFITIITFVDIAMYIITLALGGVQTPSMEFLKPQYDTLKMFGNRIPYLMRYEYQVWRFVTPVFLHANFTHICLNAMSQLIVGCAIESQIGTLKTIIVYFASAIGGNLFGALVSSTAAVGASTAIVGLLGVFIALIIVNWNRFNPMMKCMLACFALFIIFFNVIFGLSGSDGNGFEQVDNYGHLGGLITGLFAGMALIPPQGASVGRYEKRVKGLGIAFWVLYFVLGFVLFYTVVTPNPV